MGGTTIGKVASHEAHGEVGKLLAIEKADNNGSLLLSSVIYLEETEAGDRFFPEVHMAEQGVTYQSCNVWNF